MYLHNYANKQERPDKGTGNFSSLLTLPQEFQHNMLQLFNFYPHMQKSHKMWETSALYTRLNIIYYKIIIISEDGKTHTYEYIEKVIDM